MPTLSETSTTFQKPLIDGLRTSQDTIVHGVQAWTNTFNRLLPDNPSAPLDRGFINPVDYVENSFDFAEHLLRTQRDFVLNLLTVTESAFSKVVGDAAERANAQSQTTGRSKRASKAELSELTVEELRERASEQDIEGRSQMNKEQLIEALAGK